MLGKAGKLKFNTSMLNKGINKKIIINKKEKIYWPQTFE